METLVWLGAAIAVVVAVVGVAWWVNRERRRTEQLTARFGPEYRHAVEAEDGDRRAAEHRLEEREQRVSELKIGPLSEQSRQRYTAWWAEVRARFVDDPSGSISAADRLVQQVMDARGYPTADYEQRVADISVDHAGVAEDYRAAHEIAERHAATPGGLDTEELRRAMVHYQALFDELLERPTPQPEQRREHVAAHR
jgi:hypothetical protein